MTLTRKQGFDFSFDSSACEKCRGNCCSGESGNIFVNQKELTALSSFLQINIIDTIQGYLNRVNNRFSIKEHRTENGFECVFFEASKNQCSIYKVRPAQCRKYPFWEHFKQKKNQAALFQECPGICTNTEIQD